MSTTLSLREYYQEIKLIANSEKLPLKSVALMWLDQMPTCEQLDQAEYFNDDRDYHSWGYAATGDIHCNGEGWGFMWEWIRYYQQQILHKQFTPKEWSEHITNDTSYQYGQ